MSRNMRRIASEPKNIRVSFSEREADSQAQAEKVTGSFAICAFPESPKRLHVNFVLSERRLKITLLQAGDSDVKTFEMCSLDLAHLVVGWIWGVKDMFVLAAKHNDKFYHDICCFPADRRRNAWLECFESRGVRSMILFYRKRQLPVLRECNQYLMMSLSESSEGQGSSGSRGAVDSEKRDARGQRDLFAMRED